MLIPLKARIVFSFRTFALFCICIPMSVKAAMVMTQNPNIIACTYSTYDTYKEYIGKKEVHHENELRSVEGLSHKW